MQDRVCVDRERFSGAQNDHDGDTRNVVTLSYEGESAPAWAGPAACAAGLRSARRPVFGLGRGHRQAAEKVSIDVAGRQGRMCRKRQLASHWSSLPVGACARPWCDGDRQQLCDQIAWGTARSSLR